MNTSPLADLTPAPATDSGGSALRRVLGMSRANALLLTRNRMTLAYALVFPLLPLALLFASDRGDETAGIPALTNVVMIGVLFPVYYNLLSMTVTRRDELVLKRFRTGEATDGEILTSMALPGAVVMVFLSVLAVVGASAFGQPLPTNAIVLGVGVLAAIACFVGLAFWTAAWTRNAEAAQITSMPVVIVAIAGSLRPIFPESWHPFVDWTPGAAIDGLVRVGWFAQDRDSGSALSFAETFTSSGQPIVALVVWAVLAGWLATRAMRWEPRG